MTSDEFKAALKELRVKQVFFVAGANLSPTTVSRWAKGMQPIPGWVEWVIQLLRENQTNRARLAAYGTLLGDRSETRPPAEAIRG